MKLFFWIIFSLTFLFPFIPQVASAQNEDFYFTIKTLYKINKDGVTDVQNTFEIINQKTEKFAPTFNFSIEGASPETPEAFEEGISLPVTDSIDGKTHTFTVNFKQAVVGKGARRRFVLNFRDRSLVTKNGDIWELSLPTLDAQQFLDASATLSVPPEFGQLAFISPTPSEINQNRYEFKKSKLKESITAAFGQFQVYNLNLRYDLENTKGTQVDTTIAIPPDTSFQKLHLNKLTPEPLNVTVDEDGNWLAHYKMGPNSKSQVVLEGFVQVFSDPWKHFEIPSETLVKNVSPSIYWETADPAILKAAQSLSTPKDIYDYVVSQLTYDYSRVGPQIKRLGAVEALKNPTTALCQEFTDLFIALARAKGIPAREVQGYGVVDDPTLTPLSLVADLLHAWPEYWDSNQKLWVPVDPTWGKTSGLDYFTKTDLKHITFVIHGVSSDTPPAPGTNRTGEPKKLINVNISSSTSIDTSPPDVFISESSQFPLLKLPIKGVLINNSKSALYDQEIIVESEDEILSHSIISVVPPLGKAEVNTSLATGVLGHLLPKSAIITAGFSTQSMEIDTTRTQLLQLPFIFVPLLVLAAIIAREVRRVKP